MRVLTTGAGVLTIGLRQTGMAFSAEPWVVRGGCPRLIYFGFGGGRFRCAQRIGLTDLRVVAYAGVAVVGAGTILGGVIPAQVFMGQLGRPTQVGCIQTGSF